MNNENQNGDHYSWCIIHYSSTRMLKVQPIPLAYYMAEFWSITVTPNYRIIFRFEGGDVFDVDYVDYH